MKAYEIVRRFVDLSKKKYGTYDYAIGYLESVVADMIQHPQFDTPEKTLERLQSRVADLQHELLMRS